MAFEQIGEVVVSGQRQPIQLNLKESRFEIRLDEHVAFLLFPLRGTRLSPIHTEVLPELQRQGLADALAKSAIEYARAHSLSVRVICPFVAKYLVRHPEFQDLVETTGDWK